jgi:hypothetical protein
MPYQESNPERRNLTVASLAFLTYFWGGGHLSSSSVKLFIVDAQFTRPGILAVMAWAMLFWFFYRYWLMHWGSYWATFHPEVNKRSREIAYLRNLVEPDARKAVKSSHTFTQMEHAHLQWDKKTKWIVAYSCLATLNNPPDRCTPAPETFSGHRPLLGWSDHLALSLACLRAALFEKATSSIVAPYILFGLAVISGAVSMVF